jgi:uncharacterized SAM-binding protein YcdF (DUF218 family)
MITNEELDTMQKEVEFSWNTAIAFMIAGHLTMIQSASHMKRAKPYPSMLGTKVIVNWETQWLNFSSSVSDVGGRVGHWKKFPFKIFNFV